MRRRILLADDSVTIQKVIELTFMDEDYEVRAVSNGDDAIKEMSEVDPHFVIADVHMPGANGYEVCRLSKERRPDVPVLLLVGTFEPFDEAQSRAVGADSFLKKPFDSQELLQRVGELLAGGAAPAASPELGPLSEPGPFAEPAPEWGGFEVEAAPQADAHADADIDAEPFSAGSEFSLEEPSADTWQAGGYTPESEQLFELEEEPAGSAPPANAPTPAESVFGFEPQPLAGPSGSAGFELPFSPTERLGVPEAAAPLVDSLEETERRIEGSSFERAPRGLAESHEPEADAGMAAPTAMTSTAVTATAAVIDIAGNGGLSDEDVDRIARRVVELLGDKAVRDVAWEVVPDLAEVVIKDRLRELESQAENLE